MPGRGWADQLTPRRGWRGGGSWRRYGAGAWDRDGRPSWVRLDRVLTVREDRIRREGAVLDPTRFDRVSQVLRAHYGWR